MVIPSLDLDEVISLCKEYIDSNFNINDSEKLIQKLFVCTIAVGSHALENVDFGVHTITEANDFTQYDYVFDFRDEHGRLVLPFTQEKPHLFACCPYNKNNFTETFPEVKQARTIKVGVYSDKTCRKIIGRRQEYIFDEFTVIYAGGQVMRTENSNLCKKHIFKRKINEITNRNVELNACKQELEVCKKQLKELTDLLWEPDGLMCLLGKQRFEQHIKQQEDYEGL